VTAQVSDTIEYSSGTPWSGCTATSTRPARGWPGSTSSWSSTRPALDRIEVRAGGKAAGTAVPFTVGRHRHPKTRTPDGRARTEPAPTGTGYLAVLGDGHDAALREQVSYRSLITPQENKDGPEGGGRG
jgi:hypothetical protein